MKKDKILNVMNENLLSKSLLCRRGPNDKFHQKLVAKLQGLKNDFSHHYYIYIGVFVESIDFSNPGCITFQW